MLHSNECFEHGPPGVSCSFEQALKQTTSGNAIQEASSKMLISSGWGGNLVLGSVIAWTSIIALGKFFAVLKI